MKVKVIKLKPLMSVEESDSMKGMFLTQSDCKLLVEEDADVFDKESGQCLAKFRKDIIPGEMCRLGYNNLLKAATPTDSRATAAVDLKFKKGDQKSRLRIKKDGSNSKQTVGNFVDSGVAGFYDRATRFPYCRLTAFTEHHLDKFKNAYPIIKFVDEQYAKLMPEEYKRQHTLAEDTSKDFVIHNTSFTTITVNKNYRTAVHKDAGDFKGGFGNLTALRKGKFTGCHLVLPRWGVGFDLQNQDLLLMDVHQWHGNTPFVPVDVGATRLSLVMYYREKMFKCGTLKQEINRAKSRKKGDQL